MPKDHERPASDDPSRVRDKAEETSSQAAQRPDAQPSPQVAGGGRATQDSRHARVTGPGSPPAPLEPINTARLTVAAEICREASAELARQGYKPDGEKELRRFGLLEVCRYMLPLEAPALRAFLREHPDLPQAEGLAPMFTLDEINAIRTRHARVTSLECPTASHLADGTERPTASLPADGSERPTTGSAATGQRVARPEGAPAKIVSLCNFKGGVSKTTTAGHLAMAAALDGLSVLVVDLDSQASLSTLFGVVPETEAGTAYAALAWDRARAQYSAAEADGHPDPTSTVDPAVRDYLDLTADDVILPTHWPTIDILPAQLNLYWAEFQVPVWLTTARGWAFWDGVGNFLAHEGLTRDYDLIIIDTPPALGYLTINALAASDILLVPVGASFIEFDSTGRFFDMLATTFASIEETLAAHHPSPPSFEWDAVQVLLTRYDEAQQADMADLMAAYLGDMMAPHRQAATALIGQAGERVSGLYEAPPSDFNLQTYRRGRATFDESWDMLAGLLARAWATSADGTPSRARDKPASSEVIGGTDQPASNEVSGHPDPSASSRRRSDTKEASRARDKTTPGTETAEKGTSS